MSKVFTIVFQVVGIILQVGNAMSDVVPAEWKPVVAAGLTILQGIQALLAHYYNPDGTSAKLPYVPKP